MPIDLERFGMFRPYLFHLTASGNLSAIRSTAMIECANSLLLRARYDELLTVRRDTHRTIEIDSRLASIRDQKPLHAGAIAFETGWDLPRFVQHVNKHVLHLPIEQVKSLVIVLRYFGTSSVVGRPTRHVEKDRVRRNDGPLI